MIRPLVSLVREDEIDPTNLGQLFGTFRSKRQATEVLRQIVDAHTLCPKTLGLEAGKGACFAHQLRKCKGVCAGKESPEIHFLRLQQALASHRLKSWPYPGKIGIREICKTSGRTQLHVFEHWCGLGSVEDETGLEEITFSKTELRFDLDSYKLFLKELNKSKLDLVRLY